jgi:hypothetical protein
LILFPPLWERETTSTGALNVRERKIVAPSLYLFRAVELKLEAKRFFIMKMGLRVII